MTSALQIITLLVRLLHAPADRQRCLEARVEEIAGHAADAERTYGVPPVVLLVVGYLESHLGCDRGSGGNWGAPINARHRHTAGTSNNAAHVLAVSYRVCGDWPRAIARFRCGYCHCRRYLGYSADDAVRLIHRVDHTLGVAENL